MTDGFLPFELPNGEAFHLQLASVVMKAVQARVVGAATAENHAMPSAGKLGDDASMAKAQVRTPAPEPLFRKAPRSGPNLLLKTVDSDEGRTLVHPSAWTTTGRLLVLVCAFQEISTTGRCVSQVSIGRKIRKFSACSEPEVAPEQVDPRLPAGAQERVKARMAALFRCRNVDGRRAASMLASAYHDVTRGRVLCQQPQPQ